MRLLSPKILVNEVWLMMEGLAVREVWCYKNEGGTFSIKNIYDSCTLVDNFVFKFLQKSLQGIVISKKKS